METGKNGSTAALEFSNTQNIFPSILERLRGTDPGPSGRKVQGDNSPSFYLQQKPITPGPSKRTWDISAISNPYGNKRLDDIITGRQELSPTDLQKHKNHDGQS